MPGKSELVRWTIQKAARNFGLDRKTLTTKLSSLEPGTDKLYSTEQIVSVLFDDVAAERIRLYREQTRKLELANAKTQAEQMSVETIYAMHEGIYVAIRQIVLASDLTDGSKAEILSQLRHVVLNSEPVERAEA